MKLVQKLTLALILGISVVLAINGTLRVRREVALFRSDRVRDHQLVGLALGAAFAALWRSEGEGRARQMLDQASAREDKLAIRWVSADPFGPPRAGAPAGEAVTQIATGDDGQPVRRTYVPITLGNPERVPQARLIAAAGPPTGGLLITESLAGERSYVQATVIDTVLTTAFLAVVSAAVSAALGAWFVGRPVHLLADKARRVGQGDFSGPLRLRQRDELAELATEMNAMCDRLVEANEHRAAEALARMAAQDQLRHADRLMTVGKLASGIAHELGTPLNVVGARAGMIADGETTPDESLAYARIIVEACDQMTKIIRQLLDFARPRGPERTTEDVVRVAARTLALLEPIAAKKGVALALRGGGAPVTAELDAGQIQQVFTNLVVNAVQATDRGTVEVVVERERAMAPGDLGGAETECVSVRVRDEGSGIAPEHLPHVFEPFFTTKDVGQGTGLGLSVAYGIVREHRGWMEVQSTVGRGSEFIVYLPVGGPA
jgi:signal transduction histidine kinase